MSATIIGFTIRTAHPVAEVADVQAVADHLRAAYLEAFEDTVRIALRWASTSERRRLEENFPNIRATSILERICAEGQVARLQRHAERFTPESHARQLTRALRTIEHRDLFERKYQSLSRVELHLEVLKAALKDGGEK